MKNHAPKGMVYFELSILLRVKGRPVTCLFADCRNDIGMVSVLLKGKTELCSSFSLLFSDVKVTITGAAKPGHGFCRSGADYSVNQVC